MKWNIHVHLWNKIPINEQELLLPHVARIQGLNEVLWRMKYLLIKIPFPPENISRMGKMK
jgi:hypothetical protein